MPRMLQERFFPFFLLSSCKLQLRTMQRGYITSTRNTQAGYAFLVCTTQFSRLFFSLASFFNLSFGSANKERKIKGKHLLISFPFREKRRNRFCAEESASTKEIRRLSDKCCFTRAVTEHNRVKEITQLYFFLSLYTFFFFTSFFF